MDDIEVLGTPRAGGGYNNFIILPVHPHTPSSDLGTSIPGTETRSSGGLSTNSEASMALDPVRDLMEKQLAFLLYKTTMEFFQSHNAQVQVATADTSLSSKIDAHSPVEERVIDRSSNISQSHPQSDHLSGSDSGEEELDLKADEHAYDKLKQENKELKRQVKMYKAKEIRARVKRSIAAGTEKRIRRPLRNPSKELRGMDVKGGDKEVNGLQGPSSKSKEGSPAASHPSTSPTTSPVPPSTSGKGKACSSSKVSFSCPKCSRLFKNKSNMTRHIRVHTGEKPFVCELCNKGFSTSSNLRQHEKIHLGVKAFMCSYSNCGKAFMLKHHLDVHLKSHDDDASLTFPCGGCGYGFVNKSNLTKHLRDKKCKGTPDVPVTSSLPVDPEGVEASEVDVEVEQMKNSRRTTRRSPADPNSSR